MGRARRSEEWWAKHPEVLRCTAHYKSTGELCRMPSAPGTSVCNQHGALIPAVQAAAARRIQMSVDDAVKRLHSMLDDDGVDARDKIKILHDLLDRGGLGATSKVLLGVVTEDPVERLFASLLATPDALGPRSVDQHPALPAYEGDQGPSTWAEADSYAEDLIGRREAFSEVVDAEIVDDGAAATAEHITSAIPRHIREAIAELV